MKGVVRHMMKIEITLLESTECFGMKWFAQPVSNPYVSSRPTKNERELAKRFIQKCEGLSDRVMIEAAQEGVLDA